MSVASSPSEVGDHEFPVGFAQGQDTAGGVGRLRPDFSNAAQEKGQLAFPVARVTYGLEVIVIGGAMTFEVV